MLAFVWLLTAPLAKDREMPLLASSSPTSPPI
jgi:hypothetical protein